MTPRTDSIQVGLLAPPQELESLRKLVSASGLAKVVVELTHAPDPTMPGQLRQLEKTNPRVLLVDISGMKDTIETLRLVHAALPAAWVLVVSDVHDPKLIIEAVREGVREFLPTPLTVEALIDAFHRFTKETTRHLEEVKGNIYWITSAKGGSGATSIAINLSTSIAGMGNTKVVLMDLNHPVGDAATYLNLRPDFNVVSALEAGDRLDPVLLESYLSSSHGVSVLSGSREYRNENAPRPESLRQLLDVAGKAFTHTLVDMPSVLPPEIVLAMARVSDKIVISLTPELPALWRTHRLLHLLEEADCRERLFLVLNRFERKGEISQSEIERTLEIPIAWTLPNDYRSSIQAINSGRPLVSLNNTPLADSFHGLARKLTGLTGKATKKGLFSSIFS